MKPAIQIGSALLAAAVVLAAASPALAQSGNADIDRGVKLYADLEYEQAIAVLEPAVAAPGLTVEQRTTGYLHLALSHLALRHTDEARAAFRALLEADRDFVLPPETSQTARDLFDEVKRSLPPPRVAATASLSATATPLAPRDGAPITVTARVTDPEARIDRVFIHHRVRGAKSYSKLSARRDGAGWSAIIPGLFVKGPAIEYWVSGVDAQGAPVASAAGADAPLVIAVGATSEGGGTILGKWWFWGGVAVVAAGVAGGIVLLSGGDGGGGNDATVIITVTPPP